MKQEVWLVYLDDTFACAFTLVEDALNYAGRLGTRASVWRVYGTESYDRWLRTQAPAGEE